MMYIKLFDLSWFDFSISPINSGINKLYQPPFSFHLFLNPYFKNCKDNLAAMWTSCAAVLMKIPFIRLPNLEKAFNIELCGSIRKVREHYTIKLMVSVFTLLSYSDFTPMICDKEVWYKVMICLNIHFTFYILHSFSSADFFVEKNIFQNLSYEDIKY